MSLIVDELLWTLSILKLPVGEESLGPVTDVLQKPHHLQE